MRFMLRLNLANNETNGYKTVNFYLIFSNFLYNLSHDFF